MSWLSSLKYKIVAFAKAPDSLVEKVIRVASVVAQGTSTAMSIGINWPTAVINALTAVHTVADKASNASVPAKWLRYLSSASQFVGAVIALPIAWPVAVLGFLTSIHTFIDNLLDLLDDLKINKSYIK